MPETRDEEDQLPFERSSIAAIGERRRWFSREAAAPKPPDAPKEDEPPDERPSMLGALASRRGPTPIPDPERRSLLSLGGGAGPLSPPGEPYPVAAPLIAHSMLGELAGLEEHSSRAFPIERAILISLAAHVLFVVLLIVAPERRPAGAVDPLIAALTPPERDESPIPVIFQDAPGPSRENPKRSPLSDADRRAGGGDRSRPRSDTPFTPPSPGIAGLEPGPRVPRVPGGPAPARPGAAAEADRQASAKTDPNAKPSEFPSDMRPRLGEGPREMTRLAGLDAAIREAARSTVGGQAGAPEGDPEGGFVDSGPLSFDTTWYDWGPYGAEMVRRIKLHWDVPELARLGWKGSLTVRFFILADGTVSDARIIRGSGVPPFDFAALQAILKSSPFRPLPADLHSTREGVTVTFLYNMRPESPDRSGGS